MIAALALSTLALLASGPNDPNAQRATWDGGVLDTVNAMWTFHPDNGMNVTLYRLRPRSPQDGCSLHNE